MNIKQHAQMKTNGQSITEFMVVLIALVPLFLMIPLIGKYIDMNHSAINASRYVAWERTVSPSYEKDDNAVRRELRRRFFTDVWSGKTLIKTDTTGNLSDQTDTNKHWTTHTGGRLLAKFSDTDMTITNSAPPGTVAATIVEFNDKIRTVGKNLFDGDFNLDSRGLYRGDVQINVANVERLKPLDNINLKIRRHNVILGNFWDASHPYKGIYSVEDRVRGLTPTSVLDKYKITKIINTVGQLPLFKELKGFKPGIVQADILPADRLKKE